MLLPSILIQSLRRKHFLVFLASVIPIILRVQIVLSPSFFESATIQVSSMTQLQVLNSFSSLNEPPRSTRPYYHAKNVRDLGMNPPFGLFEHGIYQTFDPLPGHAPATRGAAQKAQVNGLFMDMQCIELKSFTSSVEAQQTIPGGQLLDINFELYFDDCTDPVKLSSSELPVDFSHHDVPLRAIATFYDPRLKSRKHCSSLPQQHPEFLYAIFYYPRNNDTPHEYLPNLLNGSAVVCSPTTWVSGVEVVDDGVTPNVTAVPGHDPVDFERNLWESIVNSIPEESGFWDSSESISMFRPFGPLDAALGLNIYKPDLYDLSLYRSGVLRQAVMNLTRELGPMVSHYGFRQPEDHQIESLVIYDKNRILVDQTVCVLMTVLSGLCMFLAVGILFQLRTLSKTWHRDPATMLGLMAFFLKNRQFLIPEGNSKAKWTTCKYTPLALRSWCRGLFICYGLVVIIALNFSLGKSQDSNGLATVRDEGHLFLLWKSVPTLAVLIIALYTNSSDSAIRALVPFQRLSHGAMSPQELDKSPLDMIGLNAVYHSFRFGMAKVAVTQILVALCAFLSTLSSVLLSSELVPQSMNTTHRQQSWFGTRSILESDRDEYESNRYRLKSLYSEQNTSSLSYPRNTYADLAFPALPMDELPSIKNSTARFTVAAAKLASDCFSLSEGVDFNATFNPDAHQETLWISLNDTWDVPMLSPDLVRGDDGLKAYFADSRPDTASNEGRSQTWRGEIYAWGRFSYSQNKTDEIFAWWCNYSWIEVPTAVTMLEADGDFLIDKTHPPMPDYTKARPWTPAFDVPLQGTALPESPTETDVWSFGRQFQSLVHVLGSLTLEDLGDSEREGYVISTLINYTSFVAAQLASMENRLALDETSAMEPYHPGELEPIEIALVDNSRRRAVQNAKITYALVSIIYLIVLVNTWALISAYISHLLPESGQHGLLLDLEFKGLAPEGFNALATMASLLHGSNYTDHVPHDAYGLPPKQLQEHIAGKHFRMGWFFNRQTKEKVFTVGILGDDDFKFLEDEDTPRTLVTRACESRA